MSLRHRLAASRLAPVALLPYRSAVVARYHARSLQTSARWLLRSNEYTNFTYPLSDLNRTHLAWFVADVSGRPVADIRAYLDELEEDTALRSHLRARTAVSSWRGVSDVEPCYGRRAGWYALVRAVRPTHVVETGTDKGLGSCVLAAALLRNGAGRLTTIDIRTDAGFLLAGDYADVAEQRVGDSLEVLASLAPADIFIHDSDHSAAHEEAEFGSVHLSHGAIALSDNSHVTDVLSRWAERTGRRFTYFQERPQDHWYPGAGIGVARRFSR